MPLCVPRALLAAALATSVLAACSTDADLAGTAPPGGGGGGGKADDLTGCTPADQDLVAAPAFSGLQFTQPVALVQAPGTSRWYLAEKRGVIWTFTADADATTASQPTVFADLRSRVNAGPDEAGLLGLALSPGFATDGRVYLSYTAPSSASPANLRSRLTRAVTADGLTLDLAGEVGLLGVNQPFANHNGGHIAFGPDGLLYMALGDGGSAGDPGNRAQNSSSPFGKLLRVDVSGPAGYQVPADNPFAGGGGLGEIYALGLRNPWRFSFDEVTGRLWAGDVGQNAFEEIDLVVKGGNYGWRRREGAHCFNPSSGCGAPGLIDPVAEYGRSEGFSVTGGFVYRGDDIPALEGQYLFADFGSGTIWALTESATGGFSRRTVASTSLNVASFAEGEDGELFVLDFATGGVSKLVGQSCGGVGPGQPDAGPTPVGPVTFADVWDAVLAPRCGSCHGSGSFGGFHMGPESTARAALVGRPASATGACAGRVRVVPGEPEQSVLFQKLSGVNLCGGRMPPGGIDQASIDLVETWIVEGAAP